MFWLIRAKSLIRLKGITVLLGGNY